MCLLLCRNCTILRVPNSDHKPIVEKENRPDPEVGMILFPTDEELVLVNALKLPFAELADIVIRPMSND